MSEALAKLGNPDLKLEGLQTWVHGCQFANSPDYWDGNWLRVTAHRGAKGASVFTTGPIIYLSELHGWKSDATNLLATLEGEASLICMERELTVKLQSKSMGHITMEVSITPDDMTQRHCFQFEIDQSYLTPLIEQCSSI